MAELMDRFRLATKHTPRLGPRSQPLMEELPGQPVTALSARIHGGRLPDRDPAEALRMKIDTMKGAFTGTTRSIRGSTSFSNTWQSFSVRPGTNLPEGPGPGESCPGPSPIVFDILKV